MEKLTLFDLGEKYLSLMDKYEEDPENEEIKDAINELHTEIINKKDGYLVVMDSIDSKIDQLKQYRDSIDYMIKRCQKTKDNLKERLTEFMDVTGINKIEGDFGSVILQESVKIPKWVRPEDVPEEYQDVKIDIRLKKRELLADLKAGKNINDIELIKEPFIKVIRKKGRTNN